MDQNTGSNMTATDNASKRSADERERREKAQSERGEAEPMSGQSIQPRSLDQMVSVRLNPDLARDLRSIADARNTTLSAVVREAAMMYVSTQALSSVFYWSVNQSTLLPASQGVQFWTTGSPSRGNVREVAV